MFSHNTRIALTISEEILYAARILRILDRSFESFAFLKSIKIITAFFLWLRIPSMIFLDASRRDEVIFQDGSRFG